MDDPVDIHPSPSSKTLHERLLSQILSDALPAGSKLPPERALAQQMGTNRGTLREAMRRLEQARLLTPRHGSGVTVGDFRRVGTLDLLGSYLEYGADAHEKARVVLDLLGPRAQVVEYLVSIAAQRASAQDLRALAPWVEAATEAERTHDAAALIEAQSRFMEELVEMTDSLLVRWVANPILFALSDMLGRRPELLLFEPSFADLGVELLDCFARSDRSRALERTHRFHAEVDAQLRALLEPLAFPEPTRDPT